MFTVFLASLFGVLGAGAVLDFSGHAHVAFLVDGPGLLLMLLAWFLWIAIWDSRKKWPGLPFDRRVIKLITLQR